MEMSKGIERKTDKRRGRELYYFDIEEGSKRARETEMTLVKNRCLRIRQKRKAGSEIKNKEGGWEYKVR